MSVIAPFVILDFRAPARSLKLALRVPFMADGWKTLGISLRILAIGGNQLSDAADAADDLLPGEVTGFIQGKTFSSCLDVCRILQGVTAYPVAVECCLF